MKINVGSVALPLVTFFASVSVLAASSFDEHIQTIDPRSHDYTVPLTDLIYNECKSISDLYASDESTVQDAIHLVLRGLPKWIHPQAPPRPPASWTRPFPGGPQGPAYISSRPKPLGIPGDPPPSNVRPAGHPGHPPPARDPEPSRPSKSAEEVPELEAPQTPASNGPAKSNTPKLPTKNETTSRGGAETSTQKAGSNGMVAAAVTSEAGFDYPSLTTMFLIFTSVISLLLHLA